MTLEHELVLTMNVAASRCRALCACGWVGDWVESEMAARADYGMHVRLSDAEDACR